MSPIEMERYQVQEREIVKLNRERVENALANIRLAIHSLGEVEPEAQRGLFQIVDLAMAQMEIIETHLSVEVER